MSAASIKSCKLVLAAAGSLLCVSTALAVNAGTPADAQARYRQDIAVCNSGTSNQDPVTCRREAKNALAEASRGGLKDARGQYLQNALRLCDTQQGDDRLACEARVRGEGSVEGSVAGGGVLRESVTVVPAK